MWSAAVAALTLLSLGATADAGTAAAAGASSEWTVAQLAPRTPPPGARRPTGSVGIALNEAADGKISIVEVMPGGPGAQAGIAAGDVLLRVDGQSVAGVPLPDVARKIAGPAGTSVQLDVRHPDGREATLVIVRRPLGGPPNPPAPAAPKDPSPAGGPAPRSDEGDATCSS